ncbi:MAG: hypothetical protein KDC79_14475 [Cyclobacteriaceae bacterium]|nr:hypothetical protein [Cyclobacteriaceae bacterium]
MDTLSKETTLYVYNENGIVPNDDLSNFSNDIREKSRYKIEIQNKNDIDTNSTIFKKLSTKGLEFIIYDYGYVMKIEGEMVKVILFLIELDNVIPKNIEFFVSPTQAVQNNEDYKYPRGSDVKDVSLFLDKIFNNNNYSDSIRNL